MITSEVADAVASKVSEQGASEYTVMDLRQNFPDVHFTYCMDDDIGVNAKPVIEKDTFKLYLVDGREHCLCLTNNYDVATGIVVAEVIDDE